MWLVFLLVQVHDNPRNQKILINNFPNEKEKGKGV